MRPEPPARAFDPPQPPPTAPGAAPTLRATLWMSAAALLTWGRARRATQRPALAAAARGPWPFEGRRQAWEPQDVLPYLLSAAPAFQFADWETLRRMTSGM